MSNTYIIYYRYEIYTTNYGICELFILGIIFI